MSKKFKGRIDKKDKYRALLTDTSTCDIPIVFSNDGFYLNIKKIVGLVSLKDFEAKFYNDLGLVDFNLKAKIPYKYCIRKNDVSVRTLSLVHPSSQLEYCDLYENGSSLITYLCSKSPSSIRSPLGISNSYFLEDNEEINKYKNSEIEEERNQLYRKYSKSYFYYSGYRRMYKFFSSSKLIELEKSYSLMSMIDVANCFDSIYTHSISWAVKGKSYSKANKGKGVYQFSGAMDSVISRSNHEETNGIPIGSEFSRIFSEIIFQDIDLLSIKLMDDNFNGKYRYGKDYEFYRYVDDFIIFSSNESVSKKVTSCLVDALRIYNLYVSESKLEKYSRPFQTKKSTIISSVRLVLQEFCDLHFSVLDDGRIRFKKRSVNQYKVFISSLKSVISSCGESYSSVSGFIISFLSNKLAFIFSKLKVGEGFGDEDWRNGVNTFINNSLNVMSFIFFVSPSIQASYSLSKSICSGILISVT